MTTLKGVDPYAVAEERLDRLFTETSELQALYHRVCRILNEEIPTDKWVGIYLVEGDELGLGAWGGPEATQHGRIPIGQGICGAAPTSGETIVVDDVNADPRYLACFLNTRAEIVVPIKDEDRVYGELDIDSDHRGAFGLADRQLLEEVAGRLAERIARGARG